MIQKKQLVRFCSWCLIFVLLVFVVNGGSLFAQNDEITTGKWDKWYQYQEIKWRNFEQESLLAQLKRTHFREKSYLSVHRFKPYPSYKYNILELHVIFKVPDYGKIKFKPTNFVRKNLESYQGLMASNQMAVQYRDTFRSTSTLEAARHHLYIQHPMLVDLNWNDIPDPPRIGRDSYLKTRSAKEGIKQLLAKTDYNTRPNLEKVTIEKGPWSFDGSEHVQLSQAHLANWAKGGESSVSLSSDLRAKAIYKKKKHEWESYITHKVGVLSTDDERGRINDDLIELNSKYGLNASKKWYYSFLFNFKTQFFHSYAKNDIEHETPLSGFMAPAYLTFALGMDFKEGKKFTLLLSPITSKLTMVLDTAKFDQTRYKIDSDKKVDMLTGLSVVSRLEQRISREIKVTSKLDAFYEYLSKDEDNDRQVQIDWEVILDMRINRFLSTRLLTEVKYFTNESSRVQYKENFNIAFRYTF